MILPQRRAGARLCTRIDLDQPRQFPPKRKCPGSARFAAEDLASQIAQEPWKHLVAGAFRRRLPIFVFLRSRVRRLAVLLLLEVLALLLRTLLTMRRAVTAMPAFLLAALAIAVTAMLVTAMPVAPAIAVPVAATVAVAVTLLLTATLSAVFLALMALRLMPLRRGL